MESITSHQNPRIKHAVTLKNKRSRDQDKLMTLEGRDELLLALDSGIQPVRIFWCPDLAHGMDQQLLEQCETRAQEVFQVSPSIMEKIAYRNHPDGWFCVAHQPETTLDDLGKIIDDSTFPALLMLSEDLEKPGNFGALIRTAEAVGAQGFISLDGRTDVWNPNAVRASKGTILSFPVVQSSGDQTLPWLKNRGIQLVVADPQGEHLYWDLDYTKATAFVVGSEDLGLSKNLKSQADHLVRLPMEGKVNSLNASLTGGLLLYEAKRQRQV